MKWKKERLAEDVRLNASADVIYRQEGTLSRDQQIRVHAVNAALTARWKSEDGGITTIETVLDAAGIVERYITSGERS